MHSTFYNGRYLRSNFCATSNYDIVNGDGSITTITELDPLDPTFQQFIDGLTVFDEITYKGEVFTTTVFNYYGTTTLIWLVLLVNGLMSRTELRPGMVLRFPVLSQIDQSQLQRKNNYGQVVI